MNLNQVNLIGRLTAAPELSYTPAGIPVCKMRLAVNRPQSKEAKQNGLQAEADFFNVTAWRQTAEFAGQYLGKGRLIYVSGQIQIRPYEDKEGNKRTATEIVVNELKGLDRAEHDDGSDGSAEDVPARPAQQARQNPTPQPNRNQPMQQPAQRPPQQQYAQSGEVGETDFDDPFGD